MIGSIRLCQTMIDINCFSIVAMNMKKKKNAHFNHSAIICEQNHRTVFHVDGP